MNNLLTQELDDNYGKLLWLNEFSCCRAIIEFVLVKINPPFSLSLSLSAFICLVEGLKVSLQTPSKHLFTMSGTIRFYFYCKADTYQLLKTNWYFLCLNQEESGNSSPQLSPAETDAVRDRVSLLLRKNKNHPHTRRNCVLHLCVSLQISSSSSLEGSMEQDSSSVDLDNNFLQMVGEGRTAL